MYTLPPGSLPAPQGESVPPPRKGGLEPRNHRAWPAVMIRSQHRHDPLITLYSAISGRATEEALPVFSGAVCTRLGEVRDRETKGVSTLL